MKYCNASGQRLSLEVRNIVNLFSLEDADLGEDIKEFQAKRKKPKGYLDEEGILQEVNVCTVEPEHKVVVVVKRNQCSPKTEFKNKKRSIVKNDIF